MSRRPPAIDRTLLVALALLLPPLSWEAIGDARHPDAPSSAPRLNLVWVDVLGTASFALPFAASEAAAVLGQAGIATASAVGTPSTEVAADEIRIVILDEFPGGSPLSKRVMGCTRRGGHTRTTWVYLSSVLWALGLPDRGGRGLLAREREEVGRALGRVAAHEIVHVLAPDLPHGRDGLMAGRLSRALLGCNRVTLGAREASAARAGFAALAASASSSPRAVEVAAEAVEPRHPRR
ncbi:MAG: hypothetical protein DMF82_23650 [Acidobacteria bacterium]|nr:MAG: hypothetical protein DMF82_23650 [Acidobacteriota bacterium]